MKPVTVRSAAEERRHDVLPSRSICYRLPLHLAGDDRHLFANCGQPAVLPACGVSELDDVDVPGRGPIRWRGEFRPECFAARDGRMEFLRRKKHWRAAAEHLVSIPRRLDADACYITDDWSCGYFHWMCDALPRLELLRRIRPLDRFVLLLPSKAKRHRFIAESLRAFPLADVRYVDRLQRVRCRRLFLPTHAAPTGNHRAELIAPLRERFWSRAGATPPSPTQPTGPPAGKRLFVSRRDASRRRLINEPDLNRILQNHGFEVISTGHLSWDEQIALFSQASHFASIHGAGLANMVAMPPGGSVLEIRDRCQPTPNCYVALASVCGHDYHYVGSDRINADQGVHKADVRVDPSDLDRSLDRMVRGVAVSPGPRNTAGGASNDPARSAA